MLRVMSWPRGLRRFALFGLLSCASAQAVVLQEVRVEGVEGVLRESVVAGTELSQHPRELPLTDAGLAFLLRRAPDQAGRALEPFGYYGASVEVDTRREGDTVVALLRVDVGEPVRVTERQLLIDGPGGDDSVLQRLLQRFAPARDEVFEHAVYEASKGEVQRALLARGYFRARNRTARVEVERASHSARILLDWHSGDRYRFGETHFEGSHVNESLLRPLLPYKQGELYHQDKLLVLHRRLAELDYFGLIDIQPRARRRADGQPTPATEGAEDDDADDETEDALEVPIDVRLSPAKRSRYSAGLSYGTDSGAALRLGLDRRWVNRRGHKLAAQMEIGQRRSLLGAQYRIPALDRLPGWWSIAANVREEEIGGEDSEIATLTVARTARWRGNQLAAEWNVQHERYQSFEGLRRLERETTLVYPALRLDRMDADDTLYPQRGYSLSASVRGGTRALGSDVDFFQASLGGKWIRAQGERLRWIVRGELGSTWTDDFERLPPSLRYYAGGDRSVRGYGYQELAPRDDRGQPRGGKHLAMASVELERRIAERWAVAGFVDAGDAFDGGRFEASVGVGIGLRWRSPVGPVRLDIGRGLDDPDRAFRLHLGIGPEL